MEFFEGIFIWFKTLFDDKEAAKQQSDVNDEAYERFLTKGDRAIFESAFFDEPREDVSIIDVDYDEK